jgi:hypothetical protein
VVTFAELSTLAARIAGWLDEANGSSGLAGHRLRDRMSRGSQRIALSGRASAAPRASPLSDFFTEPESNLPLALVDQRSREVGISAEIGGHAVAMAQPKQSGDLDCVEQVVNIDEATHVLSLFVWTEAAGTLD